MNISTDGTGASVDVSTEELGDIAAGIGITAPREPDYPQEMLEQSEEQNTSMVGEAGEPTAGVSSNIAKMVKSFYKKAGRHDVEPTKGGRTDTTARIQHDPSLQPQETPIPTPQEPTPAPVIDSADFADRVAKAEIGNYNTDDSHQLNFDMIDDDTIAATIAEIANRNVDKIEASRQGVRADDELYKLAELTRTSPEFLKELAGLQPGDILPDHKILAARQTLELLASDVQKLAKDFPTLDDAGKAQYLKYESTLESLLTPFMGARAEGGRALRAHSLPTNMEGGDLDVMAGMLQQNSLGLTPEQRATQIALADTPEQLVQVVQAQRKNKAQVAFDTVYETFINGILSGVTTHIINATGSAIRSGVHVVDTSVAAFFPGGGKFDTVQSGEWKAQLFGLQTGWGEAWDVSARVAKTAEKYGDVDKLDSQMSDSIIKAETYGLNPEGAAGKTVDVLGNIIRMPTERLMGGTDAFNKYMAERMSLSGQAYSRALAMQKEQGLDGDQTMRVLSDLIENPTEEMKLRAKEDGKVMTFQEDLGEVGRKAQQTIQGNRMLKLVVPFFKTPANLLKQGYLERTPLAMITKKYQDDIAAGGRRAQLARSKVTTGTMLSLGVFTLAMNGKLTGSYSKDPQVRKQQMESGWQPRSYVSTDGQGNTTYTSYDRVEPFSYIIGAVADAYQMMNEGTYRELGESEDETINRTVSAIVMSISENTLSKSYMTGLKSFMDGATKGGKAFEYWAKSTMNAVTPYSGMRRNIKYSIDDTFKRPDGLSEYMASQWSMWGDTSAPVIDSRGREMSKHHIYIPWDPRTVMKDKIDAEFLRLATVTRGAVVPIRKRAEGVPLTPHEQATWGKLSRNTIEVDGMKFSGMIRETISSDVYKMLPEDDQVKMLREVANVYDDMAMAQMKSQSRSLFRKIQTHKNKKAARREASIEGGSESSILERLVNEDEAVMFAE